MTWTVGVPTYKACSLYKKKYIQGQNRINELLTFSQNFLSASAVNFAWLEKSSHHLWAGGHIGIHQNFLDEYQTKILPQDPLGPDVMVSNSEKVFHLSQLRHTSVKHGKELLRPYGFSDELDLVLHNKDEPVAILTAFSRQKFTDELQQLQPIQKFLELYIESHPHVKMQACRRLLKTKYNLTTREIQVAEYILEGASNADISELLNVAVSTIKTHVVRVLSKTATKTRSEFIALLKEW